MASQEFTGLGDLRGRLARLSIATAAREAGLAVERLRAIEDGAAPSVFEIERLAMAYSVEPDALWDEPIRVGSDDCVTVLASQEEFGEFGDLTRAKILRVASATRDLRTLHELLGDSLIDDVSLAGDWTNAEVRRRLDDFPVPDAPIERQGVVARTAARAYSRGLIARDAMARFVGLTPVHDLEAILRYYQVKAPERPAWRHGPP